VYGPLRDGQAFTNRSAPKSSSNFDPRNCRFDLQKLRFHQFFQPFDIFEFPASVRRGQVAIIVCAKQTQGRSLGFRWNEHQDGRGCRSVGSCSPKLARGVRYQRYRGHNIQASTPMATAAISSATSPVIHRGPEAFSVT
jgi:hypothetical protein